MKKLLNGEIVSGVLNPDGTLTDVKPVETPEYKIPSEDKVGVELADRILNGNREIVYIEDTQEPEKEVSDRVFPVYKKLWGSDMIYYCVGYISYNEDVVLKMPKYREPDINKHDMSYKGHPKTVKKFHSAWYRDTDPTDDRKDMKVSFVPSNDIYEIVNSNKNESIGYVSCEGNVIYWNQYRY